MSHLYGFILSCTDLMCVFKCVFWENEDSQMVHLCGFSPSCTDAMWVAR